MSDPINITVQFVSVGLASAAGESGLTRCFGLELVGTDGTVVRAVVGDTNVPAFVQTIVEYAHEHFPDQFTDPTERTDRKASDGLSAS